MCKQIEQIKNMNEITDLPPEWKQPDWPTALDYSKQQIALQFANKESRNKFIGLCWNKTSKLYRLPRDPVNANTTVVPGEALPTIRSICQNHKIEFTEIKVTLPE